MAASKMATVICTECFHVWIYFVALCVWNGFVINFYGLGLASKLVEHDSHSFVQCDNTECCF